MSENHVLLVKYRFRRKIKRHLSIWSTTIANENRTSQPSLFSIFDLKITRDADRFHHTNGNQTILISMSVWRWRCTNVNLYPTREKRFRINRWRIEILQTIFVINIFISTVFRNEKSRLLFGKMKPWCQKGLLSTKFTSKLTKQNATLNFSMYSAHQTWCTTSLIAVKHVLME